MSTDPSAPAPYDVVYYQNNILPKLTSKDRGKFLAVDIETGEYEISRSEMKAGDSLRARLPQSQIWMVRVGYAAVHSFGGQQRRVKLPCQRS